MLETSPVGLPQQLNIIIQSSGSIKSLLCPTNHDGRPVAMLRHMHDAIKMKWSNTPFISV